MTVRQRRKRRHEGPVYELKDLTVHEVSLVDRPAIGREILITKSVGDEEDEMAKRTAPENPKPEAELEKKGAEGVEGAEPPNGAEGEPPVEKNEEPSTLTVQGAVEFLREHSEEISSLARYAVGVLERHLGDEEPTDLEKAASFDEAYRRMAAPGPVWAACDALSSVIWDVRDDEGEEGKLDAVDKTVDDFKSTLRGILTDAGVKAADAVATDAAKENGMRKVKIGDREIEVSGSDEVMAFFEGLAALNAGLAPRGGRRAWRRAVAGSQADDAGRRAPDARPQRASRAGHLQGGRLRGSLGRR